MNTPSDLLQKLNNETFERYGNRNLYMCEIRALYVWNIVYTYLQ